MGITMIASLRNAFTALIFSALVGPVLAAGEAPNLKADHPSRYIVQKGDTLWDISGRFLNEPWRWPDVWQVNPHIQNPHLIYPGDEVFLSYRDGRPHQRARGVRQSHKLRAPVIGMGPAFDQLVPFHAGKCVGHGRLFDVEPEGEILLAQPVFVPKRQQGHELGRGQAKGFDPFVQGERKEPRHVIGEIAGRFVFFELHAAN